MRRGITLTEILIGILILGVGMTSLLTLFPIGLLNVRQANRYSRSAFLVESATADVGMRNLLIKSSFRNVVTGQYYYDSTYTPWPYDPMVQDTPAYGADPIAGPQFGAYRGEGSFNIYNPPGHKLPTPTGYIAGTGLPVAYDPLWRYAANYYPGAASEARFGSGIGFIRNDPTPGTGTGSSSVPSAHGLQRITNLPNDIRVTVNIPDIFVSPEDIVLQSATDAGKGAGLVSPIVPDLIMGAKNGVTGMATPQNDWKYTWMFTGQQADATNGTVMAGDIVVFENRPFAVETVTAPLSTTVTTAVAGETVVEAIFGHTSKVTGAPPPATPTVGYGSNANRAVLLRWSDKLPDPEVRVGNWIADVTYERNAVVDNKRTVTDPAAGGAGAFYPYQRCHWYQIAKRTQAGASDLTGYREMTVWTSSPLKSLTLLNIDSDPDVNGTPVHVNAALVSPYVVNVFPRTFYTR